MNYVYRGVIGSLGVFPPVFAIDSDDEWRLTVKLGPLESNNILIIRVNNTYWRDPTLFT